MINCSIEAESFEVAAKSGPSGTSEQGNNDDLAMDRNPVEHGQMGAFLQSVERKRKDAKCIDCVKSEHTRTPAQKCQW